MIPPSTQAFQGVVGVRYKLSDQWFICGSLGTLVGLSDFEHEGMQLFVAPGAQYFFTGKSSILTYVRFGFSDIGAERTEDATDGSYKKGDNLDVIRGINIPFIIRIRF